MSNQLVVPSLLTELRARVSSPSATEQDLAQVLRALQRRGLSQVDLEVHLERLRAVNDVTSQDQTLERNAVLALDIVVGGAGALSLSWDAQEMARIYLPQVIRSEDLTENLPQAFTSSDMLPPRPVDAATSAQLRTAVIELLARQESYEYMPTRAQFFRVPRSGFTSRPAAVLAARDRVILEALAGQFENDLDEELPREVLWPRRRGRPPEMTSFRQAPLGWDTPYIVKADVGRFFESVDHSLLAMLLASRLGATSAQTRALEAFLNAVMGRPTGLPQGPLGSDIFASAYLLLIDHRLHAEGLSFVRFADDYFIGADSMAEGRLILERLEHYLMQHDLHLNDSKTALMRRSTYERSLTAPAASIVQLKTRLRRQREESLLTIEDAEDAVDALTELTADEQLIWDVVYHGTKSMEEAIEELGSRLDPAMDAVYRASLVQIDRELESEGALEDMSSTERVSGEAIAFMAAAVDIRVLDIVARLLRWFPSIAPTAAIYLRTVANVEPARVDASLVSLIASPELPDWSSAFLCQAVMNRSGSLQPDLVEHLQSIVTSPDAGLLTRLASADVLAASGALDEHDLEGLLAAAGPALAADVAFLATDDAGDFTSGNWIAGELVAAKETDCDQTE